MGSTRLTGIAMVLAATVLWSTAGLFVRLVELDAWTILGWRSVFAALALLAIVALQQREANDTSVWPSLAVVPVAVISMGAYVVSLKLTTVANVMVVYATVPFVAAGLAYFALRERPALSAIVASAIALVGVIIMVGGALSPQDSAGVAVAFAMTLAMGAQIVLARRFPNMNMALINMFAAVACAVIGLAIAQSSIPSARDLFVLMLFGVSNTALAYYFVLRGARLVPSAETGLISSLDVVLGPLWVWLMFSENPGQRALAGGTIVLAAVVGYLLSQRKTAS